MELYKGRPENIQGRLDKEIRVYDLLDSLGIEYERTDLSLIHISEPTRH